MITCGGASADTLGVESKLPKCIQMNTNQFALVSSIYTLGGLLGALGGGPCCNKYGRLISMRLTTFLFVVGPCFESLATNISLLSFGRFVSGIGAGAAIVVAPIYISEIAPPDEKGFFGAFTQVMINVGILISQLLGYFLSKDDIWRIILATAGGIGALQLGGLVFVPESPKWLAEHNRPELARQVLRKLRGHRADLEAEVKAWKVNSSADEIGRISLIPSHPTKPPLINLPAEEENLLSALSNTQPSQDPKPQTPPDSIGILSALLSPSNRPALIAVIAVMLAQQLTGINSIVMYSVHLLSDLLPTTATLLTVVVSALNVFITILCAPLADRWGRKTCLLLSIAGMGASSILLALSINFTIKILSALAVLSFVASFALGLGPVPFILANELVGPEAVGATQSWALAANWSATFLVSQFFPMVDRALGRRGRVYYVFAGFSLAFGGFIAWWVPETRGKGGADEVWGRGRREGRED